MNRKFLFTFILFLFSFSISAHENFIRPISWNNISHVVIIIFENTNASKALDQPFFKQLTSAGAYLNNYFAVSHPSQPNYIALIAGSTFGVITDRNVNINATHIGNLLNSKNKTWKTYAENYPGDCFLGASSGLYFRKHVPFLSFENVQTNPTQCANVVVGSQFFEDLNADRLPTYALYIPNINNDGHDTDVAFADQWLSATFGAILTNPAILQDTLFIITFDEDDYTSLNKVYTVFVGAAVKPGGKSDVFYNHYSILRTLEDIFEIGSLERNDKIATEITDIWMP